MQRDWNSFIGKLTAWLVGFLALASFILSYEALLTLALDSGINKWLAWLWPLTLDFFVVVASLSILKNSLKAQPKRYAWTLVVVFTILSTVFNAIHKGLPLDSYNTYVLPYVPVVVFILSPMALVFSFHLLMTQIETSLKVEMQTVDNEQFAELERLLAEAQAENDKLEEVIAGGKADTKVILHKAAKAEEYARDTQTKADQLQAQVTAMQTQAKSMADWNLLNATAKAKWIAQNTNGDRPLASHLADVLGCATSTVSRAYEAVDKANGNH